MVVVKFNFGDTLKRFNVQDNDIQSLFGTARRAFSIDGDFKVFWKDDEGDLCLIENDDEFAAAIDASTGASLRCSLVQSSNPAPRSCSVPPPPPPQPTVCAVPHKSLRNAKCLPSDLSRDICSRRSDASPCVGKAPRPVSPRCARKDLLRDIRNGSKRKSLKNRGRPSVSHTPVSWWIDAKPAPVNNDSEWVNVRPNKSGWVDADKTTSAAGPAPSAPPASAPAPSGDEDFWSPHNLLMAEIKCRPRGDLRRTSARAGFEPPPPLYPRLHPSTRKENKMNLRDALLVAINRVGVEGHSLKPIGPGKGDTFKPTMFKCSKSTIRPALGDSQQQHQDLMSDIKRGRSLKTTCPGHKSKMSSAAPLRPRVDPYKPHQDLMSSIRRASEERRMKSAQAACGTAWSAVMAELVATHMTNQRVLALHVLLPGMASQDVRKQYRRLMRQVYSLSHPSPPSRGCAASAVAESGLLPYAEWKSSAIMSGYRGYGCG